MRTNKMGSKFRFFLIFEKIRTKMAHLFALYVTDQVASRVI